jgi:hypothetical protein
MEAARTAPMIASEIPIGNLPPYHASSQTILSPTSYTITAARP